MGPRNHVLDRGPDLPWEGAVLKEERGGPFSCAKMAEAVCVEDLGGPKEACIRWGAH